MTPVVCTPGSPPVGARARVRAALIRFWERHNVLRLPTPLTGAAALRAETSPQPAAWVAAFLDALAGEAADLRQLLLELEQAWFAARAIASGRRRDSHAAAAIDLLAAAPLLSATTLAAALDVAVKTATRLLDTLVGGRDRRRGHQPVEAAAVRP
jgi:hypothetical protein